MNSVLFGANLIVKSDNIRQLKGDEYADMVEKVAESFRPQIESLPENIKDINIHQATELRHTSPKGSAFDLFAPIFVMKALAGEYEGTSKFEPTLKTVVTIAGTGPKGGYHALDVEVNPQEMPPVPVVKRLFGLLKSIGTRSEEDLKRVETQLNEFFTTLITKANSFSTSKALLGKREFEKRQAEETPQD